jgi:hypothetical protein
MISSIAAMVPEKHAGSTTMFKMLKSYHTPWGAKMPSGMTTSPSMEAIIIDGEPIVDPQLAAIVRYDL